VAGQHLVQDPVDRFQGARTELVCGKDRGQASRCQQVLRSGSGTVSASAIRRIRSVRGRDLPVSTKDRCRGVVPAATAGSSWDIRRMARQRRT
jgi:hypothetical protein